MKTSLTAFVSPATRSAATLSNATNLPSSEIEGNIQGGTLRGTGTVNGAVANNATISPGASAGTLNVTGAYTQQASGVLEVELGGTATSAFDRLLTTGAATLGGTLNVTFIGGFQPADNDSFTILTFGSASGSFATVNLPDVGAGRQWRVDQSATNVTLQVVADFTIRWAVDASGFWDVPGNWDPPRVPNSTDNVLIDRPAGDFTITVRGPGAVAASILSNEILTVVEFGVLTVSGAIRVNNSFSLNGGALVNATVLPGSGGQGLVVGPSGYGTVDGVRLDCSVSLPMNLWLFVRNGLTLNGMAMFTGGGSRMLFDGIQTLSGTGEIVFVSAGSDGLFVQTGLLTIGPGITIRGLPGTTGPIMSAGNPPAAFVNQGTIRADQPGQRILLDGGPWSNQGTIEASGGASITLNGSGWSNSGSVSITGGGGLRLGGCGESSSCALPWHNTGTITMSESVVHLGGVFTNADIASFTRNQGTVYLRGTLLNTNQVLDGTTGSWIMEPQLGFANIVGGTLTVNPSAQFRVNGGTFDGVALNGTITVESGGQLGLRNGFNLNGTIEITASFFPSLLLHGTQTLAGTGEVVFLNNGEIQVASGTTTFDSGITIRGLAGSINSISCERNSPTQFVNRGTIRVDPSVQLILPYGGNWTNDGTIDVMNGGRIEIGGSWSNSGTISIAPGSQFVTGDYIQTAGETVLKGSLSAAGTVSLQGGTLRGAGSITGSVVSSAAISPGASAGTLNLSGAYTQQSGGAFNVELGGTATSAFDQLITTGAATLDGALNVSLIGGFQPTLGQTFTILTFASRSGTFATTSGLDLGGGLRLQVNVNPTNVTLEVVASP